MIGWHRGKNMKLGFFTMPIHPPGRDYTQTLKEDREAVLLADRLGYGWAFGVTGAILVVAAAGWSITREPLKRNEG